MRKAIQVTLTKEELIEAISSYSGEYLPESTSTINFDGKIAVVTYEGDI